MKIIKPNTTQIPNVIFDYWMDKLTPAEFKVLLCICRKTFGWHKDVDRISIRQIEKMTGLGKSGIIKCTEHLIQIGLVTKHKFKDEFDGSDAPNQYEINVFIPDEIDPKNIGGSPLSGQGEVHSVDTPRVHSVDTQKKDITKERLTKERDTSATSDNIYKDSLTLSLSPSPSKTKIEKPTLEPFGSHVKLTLEQYKEFCKLKSKAQIDELIEEINDYCAASRPKGYLDYAAAIRQWLKRKSRDAQSTQTSMKGQNVTDRRTKNIDGSSMPSPADGRF